MDSIIIAFVLGLATGSLSVYHAVKLALRQPAKRVQVLR